MISPSLHALAPDLWIADDMIRLPGGIPFPVRMVVVRLPDGGLWLHSPVRLTPELRAAIDALGTRRSSSRSFFCTDRRARSSSPTFYSTSCAPRAS